MGGLRIRLGAPQLSPVSLAVARQGLLLSGRDVGIALAQSVYSTNFGANENPISESGKWLNGAADGVDWKNIQTNGGQCYATAIDHDGVTDNVAQLSRSFFPCTSNQFAEGTIFRASGYNPGPGTHELEVFVNMTITAHSITGYECYLNFGANHQLVRWNGAHNAFTPLASNNAGNGAMPAYATGDIIRIERNGAAINCYHRRPPAAFILYTTANDSTHLGGNPGMGNNPADDTGGSAVISSAGFTNWRCGNM